MLQGQFYQAFTTRVIYLAATTYAPASENLGDGISILGDQGIFPVDFQINHPRLADAQVDVERGVVVCTTLSDQYVSIPE